MTRTNELHDQLRQRYGDVERIDTSAALQLLGADLDRANCFAFRYPSLESAAGYAEANRTHYGHDVIGPAETESGVIAVLDISRSIAEIERRREEGRMRVSIGIPAEAAALVQEADRD